MTSSTGNGNESQQSPHPSEANLGDGDGNEMAAQAEAQFTAACQAAIAKVKDWIETRCDEDVLGIEDVDNFDGKVTARINRSRPGRYNNLNTYFMVQSTSPQNAGQNENTPSKISSLKFSGPGTNIMKLVNGRGREREHGNPAVEVRNHVEVPSSMGQDTELFEEVSIYSFERFRNAPPDLEEEENEMIPESDASAREQAPSADDPTPIRTNNPLPPVTVSSASDDPQQSNINIGAAPVPNMEPNQNIGANDEQAGPLSTADAGEMHLSGREINRNLEPRNEGIEASVAKQNLRNSIAAFWEACRKAGK